MDRLYKVQRHVYDISRKYYLIGRDRMIAELDPPAGGKVRMSLVSESGRACVTVSDTGPGIPEAEQARIFERHYRVERSDAEKGAGLGLAIAHRIVELHGGTIGVVSRPEQGAAFSVCLPA